ncbi:MAG: putative RNA methyltransferase [Anaerovoracaceae bacterium]
MTNRQRKKFEPIRDLLRCPCCGGDMRIETGSLRCAAGHCFDIASKGYVNLTLAQKSLKGYDSNFFENRREVMEQGLYRHVLDGILSYLRSHPLLRRILDVGCGEGYYAKSIAAEMRDSRAEPAGRNPAGRSSEREEDSPSELLQKTESPLADSAVIALDLSKDAVKCASREKRRLLASFRSFPDSIEDNSIDCILNIFTPANYGEFQRILTDEGRILKVIHGEDHLRELRQAVRQQIINKEYSNQQVIRHFEKHFRLIEQIPLKKTMSLRPEQLGCLFDMTPLLFHVDREERKKLTIAEITVDACLLVGKK